MQIVRTILWVLLLVGVLAFSFGNWDKQIDVRIWPGIVWDARVPALVIVSFLLGLLPMWLVHRISRWGTKRRINALENAARTTTASEPAKPVPEPAPIRSETTTDDLAVAREKKDSDPL